MPSVIYMHRGMSRRERLSRHNSYMWDTELDQYVQHLHAAGRAPTTIRLRTQHLARAFAWLGVAPFDVTEDGLVAYLAANQWKPESRKSVRASLRGFYGWAVKTGRMVSDPTLNLPQVSVPQGVPHPTPDDVLDRALEAASPAQILMLQLAAYAGLRRAEIAGLHSSAIDGDSLRITGKGGKVRTVPLHPRLAASLHGWLDGRQGFVFPGNDRGHLSPDWVGRQMAKVLGGDWTAHSLRHRFATKAYAGERDLLTVQQLLGHSSVATTQRYTQTPDDARVRAVLNVA